MRGRGGTPHLETEQECDHFKRVRPSVHKVPDKDIIDEVDVARFVARQPKRVEKVKQVRKLP